MSALKVWDGTQWVYATSNTVMAVQAGAPSAPVVGQMWLDTADVTAPSVPAGPWTAYTPTWTAPGTNPVIGNGVITGAYVLLGKTCHFRTKILIGSTTTLGSGANYWFGLPFPVAAARASDVINGKLNLNDVGIGNWQADVMLHDATLPSLFIALYKTSLAGAMQYFGPTTPIVINTGDSYTIAATYEVA